MPSLRAARTAITTTVAVAAMTAATAVPAAAGHTAYFAGRTPYDMDNNPATIEWAVRSSTAPANRTASRAASPRTSGTAVRSAPSNTTASARGTRVPGPGSHPGSWRVGQGRCRHPAAPRLARRVRRLYAAPDEHLLFQIGGPIRTR